MDIRISKCGETCNMEGTPSSRQQSATWRWAEERASIESRSIWLKAQVSDLNYKIHQLNKLHRQLRNDKGAVQLQFRQNLQKLLQPQHCSAQLGSLENGLRPPKSDFSPCSPSLLFSNVNKQSLWFRHTFGGLVTPHSSCFISPGHSRCTTPQQPTNGLSSCPQCGANDCSSCAKSSDMENCVASGNVEQPSASFHDTTHVAARTLPVQDVRHRLVLRCSQATCKAQCPVTPQCTCDWPTCCIVRCSGNVSRITLDPEAIPLHERVGLLCPSFHPVLSLSHEIPLHIHLNALLRQAKAQHRRLHWTNRLVAQKHLETRKRQSDKSHPLCLIEAIEGFSGSLGQPLHSPVLTDALSSNSVLHGSQAVSTSSTPTSSVHCALRKHRGESLFYINNFGMPLSMATAHEEKIQYKEILTPSWKLEDIKEKPEEDGGDYEVEDLSDEAFAARHAKYENKERARWNLQDPSIHKHEMSFHKSLVKESIVQPWECRSFPLRDHELKVLESVPTTEGAHT
uniref:PEHE domain-containing protein n=1 Tax=Eptatretus burgeri TaxID=7764 RepID=A0A8C4QEK0_EPTBU